MPWVGIETRKMEKNKFLDFLLSIGFKPIGSMEIEVKTSEGWIKFFVAEVLGFVGGIAKKLAFKFQVAGLEGGRHLILGETSAKLWNECVKIVFQNGKEEVVPVYIYDGFLGLKLPTDKVKGLEGYLTIEDRKFNVPLTREDLKEIYSMGEKAAQKLDKVISAYSYSEILSNEAFKAMLRIDELKEEITQVEIDYDAGYVIYMSNETIYTKRLYEYVLDLVFKGKKEKAKEIFSKAPEKIKKETLKEIGRELKIYEKIKLEEKVKKIKDFLSEVKEEEAE